MKQLILCLLCLLTMGGIQAQQRYELASPDGRLTVTVEAGDQLRWSIAHDQSTVMLPSAIGIEGETSKHKPFAFGKPVKVQKAVRKQVDTTFPTPVYKKAEVKDYYNLLRLNCKGNFDIEFRAYNDGVAYRLIGTQPGGYKVSNETVEFNFAADHPAFIPYVNDNRSGERYCYSFESYYDETPLSQMYTDSLAITPFLVDLGGGKKAVIMEAGLQNYPGLFLQKSTAQSHGLQGSFAPLPEKEVVAGHARLNLIPTQRSSHIAEIETSSMSFPWRIVLVSTEDTQLADNDMMQRLSPPCAIDDTSWIKPGKVAWDWWNTCNLTGVPFKAGMNTPTYKAYIDFAAENGLEYIIIDEGWSGKEKLLADLNQDIDLQELVAYGNGKGVGIILWASWRNIAENQAGETMEQVLSHYADMGIKGFKVDFFDRDDQPVIRSVERLAEAAARHRLLLDLHGLKPYGVQRAYPNIVNFEGVKGLENAKWEPLVGGVPLHDFPRYDVTIPYLRQLAGPLDYTPGAMMNATRTHFRAVNDHPMSQGTRVHQMAMYTIYEAPLQMLADSPSKYRKEQECTDFIAQVPTVFDETVAIDGAVGEYITLARRKGDVWYIGSMTNWTPRTLSLVLSFLGKGSYEAEIFCDGINADREATDYRREVRTVTAGDVLTLTLAPGGGWTAILKPVRR